MPVAPIDLAVRFAAKVAPANERGCRLWTASINKGGYGQITITKGVIARAHRVAWELANGPIPAGRSVLHSCDVRRCCSIEHLRIGTHGDNNRDTKSRGRNARGETNGKSILRVWQVLLIRKMAIAGFSLSHIAQRFGVSASLISMIAAGKRWTHVPSAPQTEQA